MTRPAPLIYLLVAFLALFGVASCGSGAVSGPAPVTDPTRITILPSTATLFAGVPTTFVISGGTGSYIVSSSNQAVVPVAGSITGNSLVVTPNAVGADTPVTLTVRDTGTTPLATATLTVRPGTVSDDLTVTATSTQGLACAPAICSGGDAEVVATLTQLGVPLAGRSVRFDVVTGDYRFITSAPASGTEILDTTTTVVTDQSGRARARIRILTNAANQTALLQATDTSTGSFQRTSFVIAQATGTSPGFFAAPSSLTFQGARQEECAGTNITGTFYVFGGTPPYVIANTISALIVRPDIVTSSGAGFTVTPTGVCIGAPGAPLVIRDAAGRTTTVNVSNIPGTATIPALSASPSTVNLSSCDASANIQVAGGRSSTYFVASGSDAVIASISGNTVTVRRRNPGGPAAASGNIGISDGTSVVNVGVTISGLALGACPTLGFTATPTAVTLSDCTSASQVFLSGGSGTYQAVSGSSGVSASVSGNVVSIRRVTPSAAFSGGTVTVSDGSTNVSLTVSGSGAGAGACGGTGGPLTVSPATVTLASCSTTEFVQISGASSSGTLSAVPNNSSITASISGSVLSIRRNGTSPAFAGGSVTVSDGTSSAVVTVNTAGEGAGPCPTRVAASPSNVTLSDCNAAALVTLSGGTGGYSATSSNSSLSATVSGNILSIRRVNPSSAFTGGTVTVGDGSSATSITVNATGNGAAACPTAGQAFVASPTTVELGSCSATAQVTLSGGSGTYSAASQNASLTASTSGNVVTIRRSSPSPAFSSGTVIVSDGSSNITVTVNGVSNGAGQCPTPGQAFAANPTTVQVSSCTAPVQVTLSGGTGTYSAASQNAALSASVSGSVVTIQRASPSGAFTSGTVVVSDGASNITITVNGVGAGAGQCPTPGQAFAANPTTVQLSSCSATVQVTLSGGIGSYSAASQNAALSASVSGSVVTIQRASPSGAFTSGTVVVSDGTSSITITVNGVGAGAGQCPTPGQAFFASPTTVQLNSCSATTKVFLTGGTGSYSTASQNASLTASITALGEVTIGRASPSGAFTSGTVIVSDGASNITVTVNGVGTGAGQCPTPGQTFTAAPTTVQLSDCINYVSVTLSGGAGPPYSAASQSSAITASVVGTNEVRIQRASPSASFSSGSVVVSDGSSTITIAVNGVGQGTGSCSASALSVSPTSVDINSCSDSPVVTISGGTGTYSAVPNTTGLEALISGNLLSIRRKATTTLSSATYLVTVSDGTSSTLTVPTRVNFTGGC